MSGITFGSVGDIIAVGQIALALAQALSSSRGSAKEYQSLVKELEKFDQALLQVSRRLVICTREQKLMSEIGDRVIAEL